MDSTEQMADQIVRVTQGQPAPTRARVDYAYVVYINGRWHPGVFTGNATGCTEHIEKTLGVDLGDGKTRWARGHLGPNGNFVIHPANDRDAAICIEHLLTKSKQSRG